MSSADDNFPPIPYQLPNISYDKSELDNFLKFNYKDFPIIIGAIAGSVGLILIVLSAIVTWYCCTYTLKRSRDAYYLDDSIEKESKASSGPGLLNNSESVIFMGIESFPKDLPFSSIAGIKRSQSAPLNVNPLEKDLIRSELVSPLDLTRLDMLSTYHSYTNSEICNNPDEINVTRKDSEAIPYSSRSQLYVKDGGDSENTSIMTDDKSDVSIVGKVNFSKKRKNRMRNDSAAAIALNKSGASPFQFPFLHKDTDSLVDNEAFVVYDERTVL